MRSHLFYFHLPKTLRKYDFLNCYCLTQVLLEMIFKMFLQLSSMELQGFYGHDADSLTGPDGIKPSPFLLHSANKPTTPTLKFHNHFPPDVAT